MDYAKNIKDTTRMTIGNGCVPRGGKKGDPCNLVDFVQFINKPPAPKVPTPYPVLKDPPAGWDPLDMKPEHVDWAAKALNEAEATGPYEPNKIVKGLSRYGVDDLFRKAGEFISGAQHASSAPPNSVQCARDAVSTWADLRKWTMMLEFKEHLERRYPDAKPLVTKDTQIGNSKDTMPVFVENESYAKIRAAVGDDNWQPNGDFNDFKDDGHQEKVNLTHDAKKLILEECACRKCNPKKKGGGSRRRRAYQARL